MLKSSLLFKENTDFTGKQLENFYDWECEICKVLSLFEPKHVLKFSSLH